MRNRHRHLKTFPIGLTVAIALVALLLAVKISCLVAHGQTPVPGDSDIAPYHRFSNSTPRFPGSRDPATSRADYPTPAASTNSSNAPGVTDEGMAGLMQIVSQWFASYNATNGSNTQVALPPMPPMPSGVAAQTKTAALTTNAPTSAAGRAPVYSWATIQWVDESLTDTNCTGYNVYAGTDPLALPLILTITNWTRSNGMAGTTITNVPTWCVDYASVAAFGPLGAWDESAEAQDIAFIAPGWLLCQTMSNVLAISFQTFTNHAYTVQSAPALAGPWTNRFTYKSNYGIVTWNDPLNGSNHFTRLLIQ